MGFNVDRGDAVVNSLVDTLSACINDVPVFILPQRKITESLKLFH